MVVVGGGSSRLRSRKQLSVEVTWDTSAVGIVVGSHIVVALRSVGSCACPAGKARSGSHMKIAVGCSRDCDRSHHRSVALGSEGAGRNLFGHTYRRRNSRGCPGGSQCGQRVRGGRICESRGNLDADMSSPPRKNGLRHSPLKVVWTAYLRMAGEERPGQLAGCDPRLFGGRS